MGAKGGNLPNKFSHNITTRKVHLKSNFWNFLDIMLVGPWITSSGSHAQINKKPRLCIVNLSNHMLKYKEVSWILAILTIESLHARNFWVCNDEPSSSWKERQWIWEPGGLCEKGHMPMFARESNVKLSNHMLDIILIHVLWSRKGIPNNKLTHWKGYMLGTLKTTFAPSSLRSE